jgi:hypothetical protein
MIASLFADSVNQLIIEFVPKSDPKVTDMLRHREDIFDDYTKEEFEKEFSNYFVIVKKEIVSGSERTLYFMNKRA